MNEYRREKIINDKMEFTFGEAEEFQKFLNDVDADSQWIEVEHSSDLTVNHAGYSEDIIEGLTDEAFNDTVSKGTLLSIIFDGKTYYLGSSALPTLKARAGISGTALNKVKREDLAIILNKCLAVSRGGALLRIVGDKVRACHSNNYQILPQSALFRTARKEIEGYSNKRFSSGVWSHDYMVASWNINDEEVAESYAKIFHEVGIPIKEDKIETVVSINTSDVGTSGATIWYTLCYEDRQMVIGNGYKLNHKGTACISDFSDNLRDIFAGYKKHFYDIEKLRDIEIEHPVGCIYELCKKADLPKKIAKEAATRFKNEFGNAETDALILYVFGVSEILTIARDQKVPMSVLFSYQEKVARIIGFNFKKFDKDAELFDE